MLSGSFKTHPVTAAALFDGGAHPRPYRQYILLLLIFPMPVLASFCLFSSLLAGDAPTQRAFILAMLLMGGISMGAISWLMRDQPPNWARPAMVALLEVLASKGVDLVTVDCSNKCARVRVVHHTVWVRGPRADPMQFVGVLNGEMELAPGSDLDDQITRVLKRMGLDEPVPSRAGQTVWSRARETPPEPPIVETDSLALSNLAELDDGHIFKEILFVIAAVATAIWITITVAHVWTFIPGGSALGTALALTVSVSLPGVLAAMPRSRRRSRRRLSATPVATLRGTRLSLTHRGERTEINLTTPFTTHLVVGDGRATVHLTQGQTRLSVAVWATEEPDVPRQITRAPIMEAGRFVDWFWPVIRYYAAHHGEPPGWQATVRL